MSEHDDTRETNGSSRSPSPRLSHIPPTKAQLLAKLDERIFDTPPEKFDEKHEALHDFGSTLDVASLSDRLMAKVEEN